MKTREDLVEICWGNSHNKDDLIKPWESRPKGSMGVSGLTGDRVQTWLVLFLLTFCLSFLPRFSACQLNYFRAFFFPKSGVKTTSSFWECVVFPAWPPERKFQLIIREGFWMVCAHPCGSRKLSGWKRGNADPPNTIASVPRSKRAKCWAHTHSSDTVTYKQSLNTYCVTTLAFNTSDTEVGKIFTVPALTELTFS